MTNAYGVEVHLCECCRMEESRVKIRGEWLCVNCFLTAENGPGDNELRREDSDPFGRGK